MSAVFSVAVRLAGIATASLLVAPVWQKGFYATALLIACGGLGCAASVIATHRELARRALRLEPSVVSPTDREKLRNRALLDHAPVPLLFRSVDGSVHAANRAARRLFGTKDRLITPPPALLEALNDRRLPSEGRMIRLAASSGGTPRVYALSARHGAGVGGIVDYLALTDVEAGFNAAEAQALRDLLQILSHEIMNSLTPIVSLSVTADELFAELNPGPAHALVQEALTTIRRRAEGLDRFVRGYRDLARLPAPELKPIELGTLLRETQRVFEARWGGSITLEPCLPAVRVVVRADKGQVEQALLNLLNNAAEACQTQAQPRVQLAAELEEGSATILVRDNGTGVDPALREQIFHPFVSFKENGNGVGLSLARQIALGHGGSLELESPEAGTGWQTVFRMRL